MLKPESSEETLKALRRELQSREGYIENANNEIHRWIIIRSKHQSEVERLQGQIKREQGE